MAVNTLAEKGFLGSVVCGGKTVRPEPDPRKERDERKFVEYVGVTDVLGLAEEYSFQRGHQVPRTGVTHDNRAATLQKGGGGQ